MAPSQSSSLSISNIEPQYDTYAFTLDLSHLVRILQLKQSLLLSNQPESLAPLEQIPPPLPHYHGRITSLDVALQADVTKLMRYQDLERGDLEACGDLVGMLVEVRYELGRTHSEGAFRQLDQVIGMVRRWFPDGEVGGRGAPSGFSLWQRRVLRDLA